MPERTPQEIAADLRDRSSAFDDAYPWTAARMEEAASALERRAPAVTREQIAKAIYDADEAQGGRLLTAYFANRLADAVLRLIDGAAMPQQSVTNAQRQDAYLDTVYGKRQ